ncbi:MAG: hypothetical protein U0V02_12460 [Anaerolineales bacterium]
MSEKHYSRPRDKSLQAFKDWIENMVKRLNPNAEEVVITEEEWIKDWKKFWDEEDNTSDLQEATKEK